MFRYLNKHKANSIFYSFLTQMRVKMGKFKKPISFLSSKMSYLPKSKTLNKSSESKVNMDKKEGVNMEFSNISNEYKELVIKADKNNQDFFIDNSTIDHAKFLTFRLINRAQSFIRIVTGNLTELYYSNHIILETLKEKLDKNVKVEIITRNGNNSKEFTELQKRHKENLTLYNLNDKIDLGNHFLLVDDASFRIELPHKKKDTKNSDFKVEAKVNFYNEEVGGLLRRLFEDLKGQATPQV